MKLGIFTDAHYCSAALRCGRRQCSRSLDKIRAAYAAFAEAGCERIICLGDLTDFEDSREKEMENLRAIAQVISACALPTFCLMGNHDAFAFTADEFYGILGGCRPVSGMYGGRRLIFLDACYFRSGRRYAPGDSDWTDTFLPDTAALKRQLTGAAEETYVFVHQNLDPEIPDDHRLYNAAQVREILENSGAVRAVIQGHYHPGRRGTHRGIEYITYPALCESGGGWFILEI